MSIKEEDFKIERKTRKKALPNMPMVAVGSSGSKPQLFI